MANYKDIHGINIETVSSNPDNPANGQVWYNSDKGKLRAFVAADTWATSAPVNTGRGELAGAGIQTAGLIFGGSTGSITGVTEEWSGSSVLTKTIDQD